MNSLRSFLTCSAPLQTPDVTGFAKKKFVLQRSKDMKNDASCSNRQDVYSRITSQIVGSLERGVRPWLKPLNAEHAADASRNRFGSTASRIPVSTSSRSG